MADIPAPPLRSVHTTSMATMLQQMQATLAVTTYQAGKLVLLRPEPAAGKEPVINTHFRGFAKPMGFVWEPGRFAIGTAMDVMEFHDIPAACEKIDANAATTMRHDSAFLPRQTHFTGDIQIHEMAWVDPEARASNSLTELWFVNTRFSCLATRSPIYSFVPRWRPAFISSLAAEDRCHLNGLAVRDGRVRYVTALGETNTAGGWRSNKRSGGVIIDITSGAIICRGLSMPHSPRWHEGQLWVLDSGNGALGIVDEYSARLQTICKLPGFTRGLDFVGPIAFIGLSQVRESAMFSGIAIADMPESERCCGIWAVDTRNGQTIGFVKFTDALQEIFAVQALRGLRWPDVLHEDAERVAQTFELPL